MIGAHGLIYSADFMRLVNTLVENMSPNDVLNLLSGAKEFSFINLRRSERTILNDLNKPSKGYTGATLKYANHSRACCID